MLICCPACEMPDDSCLVLEVFGVATTVEVEPLQNWSRKVLVVLGVVAGRWRVVRVVGKTVVMAVSKGQKRLQEG
jgi:hypothetical protein